SAVGAVNLSYNAVSDGVLNVTSTDGSGNSLVVGDAGRGTFNQGAGTVDVAGNLIIGNNSSGASGASDYSVNGGQLTVSGAYIKLGVGVSANGRFGFNDFGGGAFFFGGGLNGLTVQVGLQGKGLLDVGGEFF